MSTVRVRHKTKKICAAEKKSISSAENQKGGREATRVEEHRAISALRRYVESVGRGDGRLRGSAKELGLSYPDRKCSVSPTGAHYYIEVMRRVYRCKYCWAAVWQPCDMWEAKTFADKIHRIGLEAAYLFMVNKSRKIIDALVMLNALRVVKDRLDRDETATIVAAIVSKYESTVEGLSDVTAIWL